MGGDVSKKNSYELEVSKKNGVKKEEKSEKISSGVKTKRSKCWKFGFSLLVINLVINLIGGAALWCTNIYYESIYKIISFHDGGYIFELWCKPSVPRMIHVYPFNYTNMEDVKRGIARPHVQELGPFVFREHMKKVNVEFHADGTLTFQENRTHEYAAELSKGSLEDDIILPNFPVLAAHNREGANLLEYAGVALLKFSTFPDDSWKLKVKDIIWGYDDRFTKVSRTFTKLLKPSGNPSKFGILSLRSGLNPDKVTIGSGIPDLDHFALITKYNNRSNIGAWQDEQCDAIKMSSDGSLFPRRLIKPNGTIHIFAKELCRKIPFKYEKHVITKEGIPGLRYRMASNVFASSEHNPENSCYCKGKVCPPCGTFNTAPCNFRLPVLVSYPHLTHADPSLRDKVTGMVPDPEKYETLIDVHEYGVTINGVSRLQINIFLNNSKNTPWLNVTDGTVLPLGWIELRMGKLTDFLKTLLKILSYILPKIEIFLRYWTLLMILLSPPLIYYMIKTNKYKHVSLH